MIAELSCDLSKYSGGALTKLVIRHEPSTATRLLTVPVLVIRFVEGASCTTALSRSFGFRVDDSKEPFSARILELGVMSGVDKIFSGLGFVDPVAQAADDIDVLRRNFRLEMAGWSSVGVSLSSSLLSNSVRIGSALRVGDVAGNRKTPVGDATIGRSALQSSAESSCSASSASCPGTGGKAFIS